MHWTYGLSLTVAATVAATAALAQTAPQPAPQTAPRAQRAFQQITDIPDPPAALAHVERATKLAGKDFLRPLALCNPNRTAIRSTTVDEDRAKLLPPTKVFDNLYFIGSQFVGVWVVQTSEGLILFDSLGSLEEARDQLVPDLRKLGLDPAQIKYVLVTHGHWDHYGGAQYLHDTFGARVGLSEADWKLMAPRADGSERRVKPPTKDIVVTDGMKVTLGDTTVTLYETPGHSPGTISALVPAREGGKTYIMSMLGGTAFPVTLEPNANGGGLLLNSESVERLAKLSREAGAVGLINTHAGNDGGIDRMQQLPNRKPGQPNPFVIGADAVARHYEVFDECLKAAAERIRARPPR